MTFSNAASPQSPYHPQPDIQVPVLYSKIHQATVTAADLHYQGSMTLDTHLMKLARLVPYQKVEIYNLTNGNRLQTYVIVGEAHSGTIQINGAAAHLASTGDCIIIAAYVHMPQAMAAKWEPIRVMVDAQNVPIPVPPVAVPLEVPSL